jgi:hypothetical protein
MRVSRQRGTVVLQRREAFRHFRLTTLDLGRNDQPLQPTLECSGVELYGEFTDLFQFK